MTIKHYQERVAEFPTVMAGRTQTLDACVLGLISVTGRLQKQVSRGTPDTQVATEIAGEALWLLAAACNELGVQLEGAANEHLQRLAEIAKKQSP